MNSDTPTNSTKYPSGHIKAIIMIIRLRLYNHNLPYSAGCIRRELQYNHIKPLPSLSFISRTLKEYGLTHRRTGLY